jgi:hypothetical protein
MPVTGGGEMELKNPELTPPTTPIYLAFTGVMMPAAKALALFELS